ncbi:MAG: hypothetical protein J6L69_10115 [Lachnospiraceae bacterium]|nr:hypothetical protein [Lachnospiraceae bacterium]
MVEISTKNITKKKFAEMIRDMVGDRLIDCVITINEVIKNNDNFKTGLTIKGKNSNLAPNIYIDDYYEMYVNGMDIQEVVTSVVRIYEKNKVDVSCDTAKLSNYENVRHKVCFKLINADKNKVSLQNRPHRRFMDMAVSYYIMAGEEINQLGNINITTNMMKMWNVSESQLFEDSMRNTPGILKSVVMPVSEVVEEIYNKMNGMEENNSNRTGFVNCDRGEMMYVATNTQKVNGAGVLLYRNLMEKFAEIIDDDFYILPASIHETILVPCITDKCERELLQMVREINETEVDDEDVLSNNIYRYYRHTNYVKMIS